MAVDNYYKMTINNKEINAVVLELEHKNLQYYVENPRVYSSWDKDDVSQLEQEEIEKTLQQMDHVKQLYQSIEKNGGVTEPLLVRAGDYIVFDGNSRLAAIRKLANSNPIKWDKIKCIVLPEKTPKEQIFTLLGHLHIVGRKDWSPFEQAGYLYRRHMDEKIESELMAKQLGISKKNIDEMINVYGYMLEQKDAVSSKWSYYLELIKNRFIKTTIKEVPIMEKVVVSQIKSGEIRKAEDIRKFTILSKVKKKTRDKLITDYTEGSKTLYDCVDEAELYGANNGFFMKFEKFKDLTSDVESIRNEYTKMHDNQKNSFRFAIKRIKKNLDALKLEEDK